jgi:MFS family permease
MPAGSLPAVSGRERVLTASWPAGSPEAAAALLPRTDLLTETAAPGEGAEQRPGAPLAFAQNVGPFRRYRRTVTTGPDGTVHERTEFELAVPWFGWLFARLSARALRRRRNGVWWAPPDHLDERQARVLALLASATMAATFANTLFTQTATFVSATFGVGDWGQSLGGAVVRLGVVFALPFAIVADRLGRRRTIVLTAWLAPVLCSIGAIAPSFWVVVLSQTVGRPMGIALSLLAAIAAAEEMPRNSRAYALSLLALSAGLGAGVAVAALKLTDLGNEAWRLVYMVSLLWLPVALVLTRQLPETRRFATQHRIAQPLRRGRLAVVAAVALASNLFVAPASFFQNRYLDDVRGFSGGGIALFILGTGTPASVGLLLGGRLADTVGRRTLIAVCTPLGTAGLVAAFFVDGPALWVTTLLGGLLTSIAYPAYAVYRSEMFPTGNRGRANGLITTMSLLSGSLGILTVGLMRDRGVSFGVALALMAVGQLVAAAIAVWRFPETAHLELEQLNPEDPTIAEHGGASER